MQVSNLPAARQPGRHTLPCAMNHAHWLAVPHGGAQARTTISIYWVTSWLPHCLHSTNPEENQGTFRQSEYLALAQLGCKYIVYQRTKTLGSLMKHVVFLFSFLSSYFLKMNPVKTTNPVVPNLQAFTDAKSFMQNNLGVISL